MKNKIDFIEIQNAENEIFSGANQYWLKNKFHALSGCGPTSAAEILAYISKKHKGKFLDIYDYDIDKILVKDFSKFITSVREYVKPGIAGLTDVEYYRDKLTEFAKDKGLDLWSNIIYGHQPKELAFKEVKKAIDSGYPCALLILKNPNPEIDEFTWHWMNIISYDFAAKNINISTYGKIFRLDFNKIWLEDERYLTDLVWFKPEEV